MSELYDVVIIGAGSAGLSAGIYAGRARLKTLVLDRDRAGGQIKITSEVENYPGILHTSGTELGQTMRTQAEKFGVRFAQAVVERVELGSGLKRVHTTDGTYEALSVIVAAGAEPRRLGFGGEEEYRGRGIGYCATCDGEFFSGLDVFVIGAGLAAAEEALFLTRYARKVTIVARGEKLSVPATVASKVEANPQIELRFHTELVEVGGDTVLRSATFIDNRSKETWRFEVASPNETFGIFVFAGYVPQSAEYAAELETNEQGYLLTDEGMRTKLPGVFAAGDIRPKELRQLVTAVSDGAIAATNAEKYVAEKRRELGLGESRVDGTEVASNDDAGEEAGTAGEASASEGAGNRTASASLADARFFDAELAAQLAPIFERFETTVGIVGVLAGEDELDAEVRAFLLELAALTSRITVEFLSKDELATREHRFEPTLLPSFAIMDGEGAYTGAQFHGVPSGHEVNSFIIALYNTAGPGQQLDEALVKRIQAVDKKVNLKVGVSLSCTFCPEVVAATQLMALKNPLIEAEMIDVARFPDFKNRYAIMSVPAIIIDDSQVVFGKKTPEELLDLIGG
ncbi:MAG: FAD-dependent oxidoreductase [Coriobacteriales bacterium]|jgi:thioredoxin reductase (NADPH)|nr:FAD-dependent oxidoreductase [Coriobacteriales bacterium]